MRLSSTASTRTPCARTLELAKESGIPVFAWDRDITNTDLRVGVVKKDNYSDYYNLGVNIAEDLNGEGKVAFLLGFAGNSVTEEAHAGLLDAFADYPDIEVVYTGYCNNSRADALTMFESVYLANRDITCVVGETDEVALGVLQVLKAEGRDDILVYGHDGQKEAYEAIINGEMMATAANPMDLLYTAIEMTANYLETGTIEEDVIYVPTVYVDSENVEEMYDPDSPF